MLVNGANLDSSWFYLNSTLGNSVRFAQPQISPARQVCHFMRFPTHPIMQLCSLLLIIESKLSPKQRIKYKIDLICVRGLISDVCLWASVKRQAQHQLSWELPLLLYFPLPGPTQRCTSPSPSVPNLVHSTVNFICYFFNHPIIHDISNSTATIIYNNHLLLYYFVLKILQILASAEFF